MLQNLFFVIKKNNIQKRCIVDVFVSIDVIDEDREEEEEEVKPINLSKGNQLFQVYCRSRTEYDFQQ